MKTRFHGHSLVPLAFSLVAASGLVAQVDTGGSANTHSHNKQVIGYITQWDAWKSTNAGLPSAGALTHLNIDYSKYTMLNFAFFGVASDGSLHSGDLRNKSIYQPGSVQQPGDIFFTDIYSSWDLHILFGELDPVQYINADVVTRAKAQGFVVQEGGSTWEQPTWGLKGSLPLPLHKEGGAPGLLELAHQKGVKVMASVGGWSMCKHYPEMAADPQKRKRFVDDCVKLIKTGFDGIDLDWEYPGPYSGMNFTGTQADYGNFLTLVKEIRAAIGPDKLITAAFAADSRKLEGFDWPELSKVMNYFNFMTYDMNGGWSNVAGHNAPVSDYPGSEAKSFNYDSLSNYLKNKGLNMGMVSFGLPFYGRGVVVTPPAQVGATTVKRQETVQPDGPITTSADFTNWPKDVFDGTPNYEFIRQKALGGSSGWTLNRDSTAKVPFAVNGNFFLSYDDPESIGQKAAFVKNNAMAGVIIWTVFGDLQFDGTATSFGTKLKRWSDVKSPLVNKVNEALAGGSSDNQPPTVKITAPANGTSYKTGETVTVSVTASDSDGKVVSVQLFDDSAKIAEDTNPSASWSLKTLTAGSHSLTVKATDDKGASTTSAAVTITVGSVGAPTIAFKSPAPNSEVALNSKVSLEASASTTTGSISKVEFFAGTQSIGVDTTAPYTCTWTATPEGTQTLRAVATDSAGLTATANLPLNVKKATDSAVTISLRRTSQWEGGYNGEFKITNNGSTALSNWTLVFDTADRLSFWGAQASVSGKTWTLKPASWESDIKPGATVTLGFGATTTGSGWNPPSIGQLNGKPVTIDNGQTSAIAISLNPTSATIEPGKTQGFTASVTGTSNTAVTWKATGGSISNGTYTAPATDGSYTVTATSAADATKSATATVTVKKGSGAVSVSIAPASISLEPSATTKFTASVTGTSNTAVKWTATGGTIKDGVYTAPAGEGSYTITATSAADATKSATATVTVKKSGSDCGNVPAWVASKTYSVGDRASYKGKIYEAMIAGGNIPPDYCPECGWWKVVSDCGGDSKCTTAPGVPAGLASPTQTGNSVNLTWNAVATSSGCTVTYKVFRDGTLVASPSTNSATVGDLKPSTTYSFTVAAVNQAGTSAQSPAFSAKTLPSTTTCAAPPSVPAGLTSPSQTSTSVNLKWDASSVVDGCTVTYNVYQGGTKVLTVPTNTAIVSGLKADTSYSFTVSATNQAGASDQTKAVTAKTTPASISKLPKHILTGYWQNFNNGAKVLSINDVPKSYDLICVSFADATGTPGAVTFNLDPSLGFSEAQFIQDIATAKARGQHVIISVGGQNGTISVSDSTSATNFANSINTLMDKYGFEGVDIDLENGVNATYMAQALRAIKSGAIITLAPQTIDMQTTGTEYFKLALSIKDILTVVNMQYYNSGSMLGYDGKVYSQGGVDFLTALAAIQLENGLRPDQVGLGLPANTTGAGSGYVDPSIVNNAMDCLSTGSNCGSFHAPKNYPGLRGAMTWSINWDASNGYKFANTVRTKLDTMP